MATIPDQKAERIVQILRDDIDIVALFGLPQRPHSNQGQSFESQILSDLCSIAFIIKKNHTAPYHLMGGGLVKRMNKPLSTLLRSFVDREGDWEKLYCYSLYRTTKHAPTGLSPYEFYLGVILRPCKYPTC